MSEQGRYAVAWGRFEPATLRLHGTEHTATTLHTIKQRKTMKIILLEQSGSLISRCCKL